MILGLLLVVAQAAANISCPAVFIGGAAGQLYCVQSSTSSIPCSALIVGNAAGQLYCVPMPAPTPTPPPGCTPKTSGGLVVDTCAHPMTALAKPALRVTVIDPQFGTTIRRITEVVPGTENSVAKPMYSTIQAWNADESKLILWVRGTGHVLFDGQTYLPLRLLNLESPTDIEHVLWDPVDPDLLYYPSNANAIPRFMQYRVSTGVNTVYQDMTSPSCPAGDWAKLLRLGADPMWLSWAPRKVVGLNCGDTKFGWDIATKALLGGFVAPSPNAPMPTPSGNRFYMDGKVYGPTLQLERLLGMAFAYEHASLGRLLDGTEFLGAVAFTPPAGGTEATEVGSLVLHNLATGTRKVLVGIATGYPYPPSGTHISAMAQKAPGMIAVSIIGNTDGQGVLMQELLRVNANTGEVARVAHHRSQAGEGPWGYWGEPHATISPNGKRILFASDWGGGASVDVYVVELP